MPDPIESQSTQTAAAAPIFGPDGQVHLIPNQQIPDALKNGGELAVPMRDPHNQLRYVPKSSVPDALKAGGKVDFSGVPQAHKEGFLGAMGHDLAGMAEGMVSMPFSGMNPGNAVQQAASIATDDLARQGEGRTLPYRLAAGVASQSGVNARGMEQAANEGDTAGVMGHAAAPIAAVAATEAARIPAAQDAVSKLRQASMDRFTQAKTTAATAAGPLETAFPNPAAGLVPEAKGLPPKAISGAEDIFRAAAPTGMNKGFRANLYAAAPDLADIGRNIKLAESKGGIINPDARVRATVDAIRDHLDDMYQNERAPQIQKNANLSVDVGKSADAQRGLEYLESTAPENIRKLATKALGEVQKDGGRAGGSPLTVQEADALAQAANQNLKTFERATPEGKMQLQTTNPKVGGLKSLDTELGRNLNQVLTGAGETGLRDYERRYAALSAIRDQLESRMNAAELPQEGMMGAAGRVTRPAVKLFTKGGRDAIASASQAATADVNIGRMLQTGFRKLSETSLSTANRRISP